MIDIPIYNPDDHKNLLESLNSDDGEHHTVVAVRIPQICPLCRYGANRRCQHHYWRWSRKKYRHVLWNLAEGDYKLSVTLHTRYKPKKTQRAALVAKVMANLRNKYPGIWVLWCWHRHDHEYHLHMYLIHSEEISESYLLGMWKRLRKKHTPTEYQPRDVWSKPTVKERAWIAYMLGRNRKHSPTAHPPWGWISGRVVGGNYKRAARKQREKQRSSDTCNSRPTSLSDG